MGSSQAAGHQHHRHGLAMRQMQQDLLITDWALHPSAYPSVMQSIVFDGALHHVCVCGCGCVCVCISVTYSLLILMTICFVCKSNTCFQTAVCTVAGIDLLATEF